jgi:pimeloyl-ACP methyl ester carboxylesterase
MGIVDQLWRNMIHYSMIPNNKRILEKSQSVMISGQCLFYRIIGTGKPLLLLHGYGASGAIWQRMLPFLAHHYQVIVVDLPGHGRSQFTGTWRLREIAPLLARWLQQMELQPVGLIGHSMGGAIAIHLTASAPELIDRLILVNAAGLPLRAQLPTLAARSIGSFFQPGNGSYPPEMLLNQLSTSPRLLWQCTQEMVKSDFRAELALISVPTLIIWGERDLLLPLPLGYELHAALPHATFMTVPECGHRPMLGQPAKLSRIMLRFLQEGYPCPYQS